ncbi:hypothetical protein N0V82_005937 [Gnomoniopsis sp. IMI 355080]|nr:hypothetical protein N0V82_005937 [Gnomoniopsis sp. IMI 355080]
MSGARPSNSGEGRGDKSRRDAQVGGQSEQGKGKKRAASPVGSPDLGVDEETESQEAKRHSTGRPDQQRQVQTDAPSPNASGLFGGDIARSSGNDGYPTGGGIKPRPGGSFMPGFAVEGSAATQRVEQTTGHVSGTVGMLDSREGGADYLLGVFEQVLNSSPSGLAEFAVWPVNNFPRHSRRGRTRAQYLTNRPAPFVPASQVREEADRVRHGVKMQEKVAEAILDVFQNQTDVDMGLYAHACHNCGKRTHETGHCHMPEVAHGRCDTIVDSFCGKLLSGRGCHALDSEQRFDENNRMKVCRTMIGHFESNRWTDLFIHLVVYRIHKPPLRVHGEKFCWIHVLIKYATIYCEGHMPQQIVDRGGLLPYTKNDVATFRERLQAPGAEDVMSMPPGELDGRTIAEIKEMLRSGTVPDQIFKTKGTARMSEDVKGSSQDTQKGNISRVAASGQATVSPMGAQSTHTKDESPEVDMADIPALARPAVSSGAPKTEADVFVKREKSVFSDFFDDSDDDAWFR